MRGFRFGAHGVGLVGLVALALAGCHAGSTGGATGPPSPGFSIPGTHESTTVYQISSQVSTVIVTSRVGDVTVIGYGGAAAYLVSADANLGKVTVSIPRSASSAHTISASTDVGAILVASAP